MILFCLWLSKVGKIATFSGLFHAQIIALFSRCCTGFVVAACTTASSIHHGKRCVAGGPGGISCGSSQHTAGISIHHFPNRIKDQRRFRLWIKFVCRHRPNWSPSGDQTVLCSIHFEKSCCGACFNVRRDVASSLGFIARLNKNVEIKLKYLKNFIASLSLLLLEVGEPTSDFLQRTNSMNRDLQRFV